MSTGIKPGAVETWVPIGVEPRNIAVDGLRIRYLHAGNGPALLMVHGLLGYSFSWRFNLIPFSEKFSVFAPDLPGIGHSERRHGLDYSLEPATARLVRLVDELGIKAFHLLGTSHGGALAILLAAQMRHRVRKLVLIAPANPWSKHGRSMIPILASGAGKMLIAGATTGLGALNAWGIRRMYGDKRRISPGTLKGYAAHIRLPRTAEYVHSILSGWRGDMKKLTCALDDIADIPTLLGWGDRDRIVRPESAPELQKRLPKSKLVFFPGAGHLPYEELPEEFNRVVMQFLVESPDV